jgi:hypothetical protein
MDKCGKGNYVKAVRSAERERKIIQTDKDKTQHKHNKEQGKYKQNRGQCGCIREPR